MTRIKVILLQVCLAGMVFGCLYGCGPTKTATRPSPEVAKARAERAEAEKARQKAAQEQKAKERETMSRKTEAELLAMLQQQVAKVAGKPEFVTETPGMIVLGAMDQDSTLRIELIEELGKKNSKKAIPLYIKCLTDPQKSIVTYGVHLTQGVTGPATYAYPVRNAAAMKLKKTTGMDFGQDKDKWTQWWEAHKGEILGEAKVDEVSEDDSSATGKGKKKRSVRKAPPQ